MSRTGFRLTIIWEYRLDYTNMPPGKPYKIVVLGAKQTGKTAIIEQSLFGTFVGGAAMPTTIEDVYIANVLSDKNIPETFRIYDTAGLDSHKPIVPRHYYSVADAYMLVFDITRWDTFHCLNALKADIDKNKQDKKEPVVIVLGNKIDLESESRQIDPDTVQKWAHREKVHFMEVTATDKKSLGSAFTWLATKLTAVPQRSGLSIKFKKAASSAMQESKLTVIGTPTDL